jgi:hypothetical protein
MNEANRQTLRVPALDDREDSNDLNMLDVDGNQGAQMAEDEPEADAGTASTCNHPEGWYSGIAAWASASSICLHYAEGIAMPCPPPLLLLASTLNR